jgi:hypothetical protein
MRAGDTFIRAGRHVNTDPHLWVVISDPSADSRLVCVNVTSQRRALFIQVNTHLLRKRQWFSTAAHVLSQNRPSSLLSRLGQ